MAKILLVEDEIEMSETLKEWLVFSHNQVEVVHNGKDGLDQLLCCSYDLAILDWNLPGMTGPEICKALRDRGNLIPIIFLTSMAGSADKIGGLDAGADDYLTKPVNLNELNARIRSLLRRASGQKSNLLELRGLVLDPAKYLVTKDGVDLPLLPKEFAVLEFLMRHPDEVFSAEALIERVWKSDSEATPEAIRTCIKRLRKKIEDDEKSASPLIQTIYGVGYRLRSK